MKIVKILKEGGFRHQSSFKTYAYSIVKNTCIDHYRASRAAEMVDISELNLASDQPGADDTLMALERRRVAFLVLQSLPKECRQLWRTIFFGKLNYLQAAGKLGLAEGTVKRKMWECRQLAKKLVDKYER